MFMRFIQVIICNNTLFILHITYHSIVCIKHNLYNHLVSFSYFELALLSSTSFVLLLSYILHSDVIWLTIQLCTYCVLFDELEEICNYIVFYIYLNNYFYWCSLLYVNLNYCLLSLSA